MSDQLDHQIAELIAEVLGVEVDAVASLRRGEDPWDSLRHLEIVFAVEDACGVRLSTAEVTEVTTPAELAGLVRTRHGS